MSQQLPMKTHDEARRTLARIIREYKTTPDAEREHTAFRNLVYGFNTILSFFKLGEDLRIDEKLDKVMAELEARKL